MRTILLQYATMTFNPFARMEHEPARKRRRHTAGSPLKILRGAERASVTRDGVEVTSYDKELWIIRVPRDVNVSSLAGNIIHLDDSQQTMSCEEKNYDIMVSSANATSSLKILIPTSKPGRLRCGADIKGEVSLLQTVDIPEVEVPPTQASTDKITMPVGLKQRWKPFGWKSPYVSPAQHKKSTKHKKVKKDKRLK